MLQQTMTQSAYSDFYGFITSSQCIHEKRHESFFSLKLCLNSKLETSVGSACLNMVRAVLHEAVLQTNLNGTASRYKSQSQTFP